jgi:hypothetical protein
MREHLSNPDDLEPAEAYDCLHRLHRALPEIETLLADDPPRRAELRRLVREAWSGRGRFADGPG